MKKSIITIVAFMLLALAGFAQGGEIVSIKVLYTGTKNAKLFIYEKGNVTQSEIPSTTAEGFKPLMTLLETYTKQGYKLTSSLSGDIYVEYILQKD